MLDVEIAKPLYEVASYYSLAGEKYKSRAFEQAAKTLDGFGRFVEEYSSRRSLVDLPAVERSIAKAVREIQHTGSPSLRHRLVCQYGSVWTELARTPYCSPRVLSRLVNRGIDSAEPFGNDYWRLNATTSA